MLSSRRLFSPQSGEPYVKRFKRAHERLDFAQLAALSGLAAVKNSERRFLLRNGLRGKNVDQIERPLLRHAIAKFVSLRKVISGIEEQHRQAGYSFCDEVRHYHVFRLKTAGQAKACVLVGRKNDFQRLLRGETLQFLSDAIEFHLTGPFLIALRLCEPQGIRQRQSALKDFISGGVFVLAGQVEQPGFYFRGEPMFRPGIEGISRVNRNGSNPLRCADGLQDCVGRCFAAVQMKHRESLLEEGALQPRGQSRLILQQERGWIVPVTLVALLRSDAIVSDLQRPSVQRFLPKLVR